MDDNEDEHDPDARVTAPMQEFTSKQVGIGFLVLFLGLVIAFGIPLALL